ncbi:MAG: hypothetical protein KDI68_08040 [Gammaproteobacteria bacterium]|nr:hypothetical protein [Gammaproteobacteria bacterium]
MIILIPGIPADTNPDSLQQFLQNCMNSVWLLPVFRRRGRVERCEVLRIKDPAQNRVEYHGLAYVDDETTGEALIKQISSCRIDGRTMQPRIYHSRSSNKERRMRSTDPEELAIVDRRRSDRRRNNLIIDHIPAPLSPASVPS